VSSHESETLVCETLVRYMKRSFMDVQVIANVATRLQEMHNAGYAHHDLKPANVMWIPRENQWTLIDFGSAGRLGRNTPLRFTLAYAAPEVLKAWKNGEKTCISTTAIDAWALGVMVYEMLTCKPAFDVFMQGRDAVRLLLCPLLC
jgi:serine/threonine protein kinase